MGITRFEDLEIWQLARELYKPKGSCSETRNQSYRAFDSSYISKEVLDEMLIRTDIISRKTTNLIKTLKSSDHNGVKYD